jgi:hypothetical protein
LPFVPNGCANKRLTGTLWLRICVSDTNIAQKADIPPQAVYSHSPCATYVNRIIAVADKWEPYDYQVDHCLSEIVPEQCSYSGNIPIVAVVFVCNVVKFCIMMFVALRLGDDPLITIGDAVESFLDRNDKTTKGLCLLSKKDVLNAIRLKKNWSIQGSEKDGAPISGKLARRRRVRWAAAAGRWRWSLTIGFILLALVTCSILLALAVQSIHSYAYSIGDVGFGKVTPVAVISGWNVGLKGSDACKILSSILIANLPQTILSFLYLNLNGLLTSMWLADEWSHFATERKSLRVSKPKGKQRSTHFLQLPYKIAAPLMVFSGLLHWMISQSIFLAVVAEYDPSGAIVSSIAIASCGYSPLAIILVIVLGGLIIVTTSLLALFRRCEGSIPLVGSCSAAIAAACHQPSWDTDASLKAVRWGAIPDVVNGRGVGHCAFSSGQVESVVEGKEYAGLEDEKCTFRRRSQGREV